LKIIQTADDFVKWAMASRTGDVCCYYRGFLMKDRATDANSMLKERTVYPEYLTAEKAWQFYEMDSVKLYQKRVGIDDYFYLAVLK